MSPPIGPVAAVPPVSQPTSTAISTQRPGNSAATPGAAPAQPFNNLLDGVVNHANQHQIQADTQIQNLLQGKTDNIQDVVMTMAKADLSFRMVLELRNKLMDAYQEIMRMQV